MKNSVTSEVVPETSPQFLVPYSLDLDACFRLTCPDCGLDFKVMAETISLTDALVPAFKQVETENKVRLPGAQTEVDELSEANNLTCPYCGHSSHPSSMNTAEFTRHAVRWIQREVVYDLVDGFFRQLESMFGNHSHSRSDDMIRIDWKFEAHTSPKPIRPISGPELPDMKLVQLLCCGKTTKVADDWVDTIHCPYCSQELIMH